MSTAGPAFRGGMLALLSAVLFGMSTPLIARLSSGINPFLTAALLYAGAALAGATMIRGRAREAGVRSTDAVPLAWITLCGAIVAPVALAWGLQRCSTTSASLMLALEAVFTALLARGLYREQIGLRAWSALLLLTAGAIALLFDASQAGTGQLLGLIAVVVATMAWGADDALSRALADRDPGQVILFKGAAGAATTGALALAAGARLTDVGQIAGLLVVGATGYGLSLKFYLLAQRTFGAARTGSVFAFVPFIGALGAVLMGEREAGAGLLVASLLMMVGVILHLTEKHQHRHEHGVLEHEHAHTHDDGHHLHRHDPPVQGAHSHLHRHEPMSHSHPHMPDAHHTHPH